MPDVPDDFVVRQIKAQMEGHREFYRAEVARKVPAGPGDVLHQEFTDLRGQLRVVLRRDLLNIIRFLYGIKE